MAAKSAELAAWRRDADLSMRASVFRRQTRSWAIWIAILLVSGTALVALLARPRKLSADLTAQIDGPTLAEFPLLFKLTVTNTGRTPIYYWCGGPGQYPNASPFVVTVTDQQGHSTKFRLHNGQFVEGSGTSRPITKTQMFPAACDPLAPGVYTLQVSCKAYCRADDGSEERPAMTSEPFKITVVEDASALAAANDDLRTLWRHRFR